MTPADAYTLAHAGCSDAEILAFANPVSFLEKQLVRHWLEVIRADERVSGSVRKPRNSQHTPTSITP